MKAVRIVEWGQPVQIQDISQPAAGEGEVLVRVHAASFNRVDLAVIAGYLQQMLSVPMTSGTDFAGVVVEVGEGVTHVKPGDEVYGLIPIRGGTFAEYAVAKASEVALKPASLDFAQAATVPLVALTAWQSLFDLAQLQGTDRLLVQGAGGSVGSFAVQLGKGRGAYVVGVAGPQKTEYVRGLGADEQLNYQDHPVEQAVSEADVVIDTVGGEALNRAIEAVKPGGKLVTAVGQPSPEEGAKRGIQLYGVFTQANADQLRQVAELIDAGKLKVVVQQTFPLEEVQAALDTFASSKEPGKIVLTIA